MVETVNCNNLIFYKLINYIYYSVNMNEQIKLDVRQNYNLKFTNSTLFLRTNVEEA